MEEHMQAKITVVADTGEAESNIIEIAEKGDVESGVRSTMSLFRKLHPQLPPFGLTVRIEKA